MTEIVQPGGGGSGTVPDLQEVTDVGNTTTNNITVNSLTETVPTLLKLNQTTPQTTVGTFNLEGLDVVGIPITLNAPSNGASVITYGRYRPVISSLTEDLAGTGFYADGQAIQVWVVAWNEGSPGAGFDYTDPNCTATWVVESSSFNCASDYHNFNLDVAFRDAPDAQGIAVIYANWDWNNYPTYGYKLYPNTATSAVVDGSYNNYDMNNYPVNGDGSGVSNPFGITATGITRQINIYAYNTAITQTLYSPATLINLTDDGSYRTVTSIGATWTDTNAGTAGYKLIEVGTWLGYYYKSRFLGNATSWDYATQSMTSTDVVTTPTSTYSNKLTVNSANFYTDTTNNRIGINTITPQYILDVNGTSASTLFLGDGFSMRGNTVTGLRDVIFGGRAGISPNVISGNDNLGGGFNNNLTGSELFFFGDNLIGTSYGGASMIGQSQTVKNSGACHLRGSNISLNSENSTASSLSILDGYYITVGSSCSYTFVYGLSNTVNNNATQTWTFGQSVTVNHSNTYNIGNQFATNGASFVNFGISMIGFQVGQNYAKTFLPLFFADSANIQLGSTTGTKIGTATTQMLAFYNSTPIVQPTGNIGVALSNLGLVASPLSPTVATVDLTAQSAAKTATTILTPSASGMYRVSITLQVTRAATTSSILGGTTGVVITYTEPDGSVAQSIVPLLTNQAGAVVVPATGNTGNATTTQSQGSAIIYAKTGVAVRFACGYVSVGATSMQYSLHMKLEAL